MLFLVVAFSVSLVLEEGATPTEVFSKNLEILVEVVTVAASWLPALDAPLRAVAASEAASVESGPPQGLWQESRTADCTFWSFSWMLLAALLAEAPMLEEALVP